MGTREASVELEAGRPRKKAKTYVQKKLYALATSRREEPPQTWDVASDGTSVVARRGRA